MTCENTKSIGAYLLGALEYSEWLVIDQHVRECEVCRPEIVRLAGLPGLLGRLPLDGVAPSASGRTVRGRSGPRRSWRLAAAAFGVALVGTITGLAVTSTATGSGTATATWSTAYALSGTNPVSGVHGGVSLTAESWGTEIWAEVQGVPPGTQCQLVVNTSGGRTIVAGTWSSDSVNDFWVPASAPFAPSQIASLDVVTPAGKLVTLTRDSHRR